MLLQTTLRTELKRGVEAGVFVGASAAAAYRVDGRWCTVAVCGGQAGEERGRVSTTTVYDLASLTKPVVALTLLGLAEQGRLALTDPVGRFIEELENSILTRLSLEQLLSHRSGLTAWVPFYESLPTGPGAPDAESWVLSQILEHWSADDMGKDVYSDLGFILLGAALTRLTDTSLDQLVTSYVTEPLGIDEEVFFGATREGDWQDHCATTGFSPWRERELLGEVNDDNCAALGGVAGHAGMFGTATAVSRVGQMVIDGLHGRPSLISQSLLEQMVTPLPGGAHRFGWDGKTEEGSAAGTLLSPRTFGHLGFTGTSLWCDPERELVIVLLTNRVYPDPENVTIRSFRPAFHDTMARAFDGD